MAKAPRGLLDLAEFRDLQAHDSDLRQQLTTVQFRKEETQAALANAPRGAARIHAKALELVHGADVAVSEAVGLRADLATLEEQESIIEEAITIQAGVTRDRTNALCREIRTGLAPEHKALGLKIVAAMRQLRDALVAESEFRDELERGGVSFGHPWTPVAIGWLGVDRIDQYLADLPADYRKGN